MKSETDRRHLMYFFYAASIQIVSDPPGKINKKHIYHKFSVLTKRRNNAETTHSQPQQSAMTHHDRKTIHKYPKQVTTT